MARYADNSKALFDYEIIQRFTAGLELVGTEVKSVRDGKCNLRGAFVSIRPSTGSGQVAIEAFLVGADIPAYQPKNAPMDYDSTRARKLLLSKNELEELRLAEGTKG